MKNLRTLARVILICCVSCVKLADPTEFDSGANAANTYKLGTIPTLYINTKDSVQIESRENYIWASYWIDDSLGDGSIGSKNNPCSLEIKGRGNGTWIHYEKKPYRIKLSEKRSLLGMKKNKHFVLLTGVDDQLMGFLKLPVAYELSRRIGLGWTPEIRHVELVLNGDYRGLYYLVEKIRVDKDRIDITEQKDGENNDDLISGGYLLEIDNYEGEQQLTFNEGNGQVLRITYHSPDSLSNKQYNYLCSFIEKCNNSIYTTDKTNNEWETFIDVNSLAKYYILNEILHHPESFMGSCYMYKDRGEREKLKFGPLWDLGGLVYRGNLNSFLYENPPFPDIHWITEIVKFDHFQIIVRNIWSTFKNNLDMETFEEEIINRLQVAAENNYKRWPEEGWNGKLQDGKLKFDNLYSSKIGFLNSVWNIQTGLNSWINGTKSLPQSYYTIGGTMLPDSDAKGLIIMKGSKRYQKKH